MASKFLSSLKDRRKHNSNGNDEMAFVKAAAWAWYQHGSGSSEGKAMSEFDVTRIQRTSKPSRYKLEAMRMANDEAAKDHHEGLPSSSSHIQNKKNTLLDAYEVQRISRHIGSFMESNNYNNNKIVSGKDNPSSATRSLDSDRRMVKKKNKKKSNKKGFWLRHAAVCGREEDVVDPSASFKVRF